VQRDELWVTAAQSAFAVAVLANRRISVTEACALLGLWAAQLVTKFEGLMGGVQKEARISVGAVYIVLAAVMLYRNRAAARPLMRDGFRTPYDELSDPVYDEVAPA
jgi:cation:H+ antiporter